MNLDLTAIILRFLILTVLSVISQLAFHRKQYKVMIWSFAFWFSTFRLLLIRILRFYPHQGDKILPVVEADLQFGIAPLITDLLLLIGVVTMYLWIVETYQTWKKQAKV